MNELSSKTTCWHFASRITTDLPTLPVSQIVESIQCSVMFRGADSLFMTCQAVGHSAFGLGLGAKWRTAGISPPSLFRLHIIKEFRAPIQPFY